MIVIVEHGSKWSYNGEYSEETDESVPIGYTDSLDVAQEYVARDPDRFSYVEVPEVL